MLIHGSSGLYGMLTIMGLEALVKDFIRSGVIFVGVVGPGCALSNRTLTGRAHSQVHPQFTYFRLIDKCGEPTSRTTVDEPIYSQDANGTVYQSANVRSELWRYNFGPARLPALVKITNGIVRSITFEKSYG